MLLVRAGLVAVVLAGTARTARADLTFFVGATPPGSRPTTGVSFGRLGDGPVGFDVEYTRRSADPPEAGFGTVGANLLVRLPFRAHAVRFYAIAGLGISDASGEEDHHTNFGTAAKVPFAGALQLRVDYQYFRFPAARAAERFKLYPHRLAIGLVFAF